MSGSSAAEAANIAAPCLVIMAGGTGGHVFPGLAVANELRAAGWRIFWLGNPEGMEGRLAASAGLPLLPLNFKALRGKGIGRKLRLPLVLFAALREARAAFREARPDLVLGMGGYVSFPGGLMAALSGIPLFIHEQNSIPGLANRVLRFLARRVFCGFPGALPRSVWLGNPLRADIAALANDARTPRSGPLRLLVLGGSLGAQALNDTVPQGLALIPAEARPQVIHQAGEKHLAALQENYAAAGVAADCRAFIDDMAAAYAWADLVLCRAGALTVAELAAAGVASILVPYPHAVDDHQTANARFLAQVGGAILLPQSELTPESVALIRNYGRGQLEQMGERARDLAKAGAAQELAACCIAEVAR